MFTTGHPPITLMHGKHYIEYCDDHYCIYQYLLLKKFYIQVLLKNQLLEILYYGTMIELLEITSAVRNLP